MQSSHTRRWELAAGVVAAAVAVSVVLHLLGVSLPFWPAGAQGSNPFSSGRVYVDPHSQARQAAEAASGDDATVLRRVADTPTAIWLTPEAWPQQQVEAHVRRIATAARDADRVALLVVYGIADRDCQGGESAGGLPPDAYRDWVGAVADGARGIGTTVAVLEPDAVADAGQCADADSRAYAEAVSQALGGSHYVIDTGRNGNGADGEWCNPPGRAVGRTPAAGDGSLDAFLWIKPPGESDGSCNGGPPAGQWWDERALDLARAAGW